ncbi:hypothetical protein OHA61_27780 [Streptomyces sp. NBC_00885]|uniref:hypothetical protein n=1 Tax=Streptomyces sp. NBC_00885 TaxID=2975857 RepID=UPI003868C636|nr:hypothetical protein OHA61_27780 [Streptomyces sp. NBC_00885]
MLDTARPESRLRGRADRYARWAGLAVGVVAAPWWATMDITTYPLFGFGVPWVSYVTAFGLCAVGGVLLGDALTPRPREAVRTASLTPRRVRDHVPPRISRLLLLQAVFLVGLVGIGDATATQDAMDRVIRARAGDGGCDGSEPSVILWPGIMDSRQILGSLVIGTVACAWALRRVARRGGDDQQRRDRSWAIVAAWGVLVSSLLLLVVLMIATYLTDSNCGGMMGSVTSLAIYPLGLLSLFTLAWSLFTVVVPRAARR